MSDVPYSDHRYVSCSTCRFRYHLPVNEWRRRCQVCNSYGYTVTEMPYPDYQYGDALGADARAGLKHGPRGRGGSGPCDPGCQKCALEISGVSPQCGGKFCTGCGRHDTRDIGLGEIRFKCGHVSKGANGAVGVLLVRQADGPCPACQVRHVAALGLEAPKWSMEQAQDRMERELHELNIRAMELVLHMSMTATMTHESWREFYLRVAEKTMQAFEDAQRESGKPLTGDLRELASREWSAQLRVKVAEREQRDREAENRRLGWDPELTGGDL